MGTYIFKRMAVLSTHIGIQKHDLEHSVLIFLGKSFYVELEPQWFLQSHHGQDTTCLK